MRLVYTARESVPGEKWRRWTADERDEARSEVLARLLGAVAEAGRRPDGPIQEESVVDELWRCVHVTAAVATED